MATTRRAPGRSGRWRVGVTGSHPYADARPAVADPLGIDLGPDPADAVMSL